MVIFIWQNPISHIMGQIPLCQSDIRSLNCTYQVDICIYINIKVAYKLILVLWQVWPGMSKVPKMTSLQYLSNISRKLRGINLTVSLKISIKIFYNLIHRFCWPQSEMHIAPIITSLHYFKKGGVKFIFHADKHQPFLQIINTINFGGHDLACPIYPK